MKAIRVHNFGDPDCMKLEEVPDPSPGPDQAVVKLHATGVNPVDTYIRSGTYHIKPELPYTPGKDGAGVVESIGKNVAGIKEGDRVYTAGSISGTYAEKCLCNTPQMYPLPEDISFSQGAAINTPYTAAYHALFQRAQGTRGEIVLVHGATGGVGLAAVQLAREAGLRVIGTGGTKEGLDLIVQHGAQLSVGHNDPDILEKVYQFTDGRGADIVIEMLANVNLNEDLGMLAQYGRIVIVGNRGTVEINPRDIMLRSASILGMLLMNVSEQETAQIHAALGAGLKTGTIKPVVGTELLLQDAPRAHLEVMASGKCGKMIMLV